MNVFQRGIQVYLVALSLVVALAIVWGTNEFVLDNTAAGTGWPLMVVAAGLLVLLWAVIRYRPGGVDGEQSTDQYPW